MRINKKVFVFNYQSIFLFSYLVTNTVSLVFPAGELSYKCSGSLHVYESAESEVHTFTTSVESLGVGIVTKRVAMEGCGCYILYQGPRRTGMAYFITKRGQQNINLSRIKSVYRQECGEGVHRNAGVIYWAIGVVIFVVVVVGGGVICKIKRRENIYAEVISVEVL